MAEQLCGQQSEVGRRSITSSHQVGSVQHSHPSCHPAVRVLDGLRPQEVASSLVHHHLLALPVKKRATEHLQSRKLTASHLGQFNSHSCHSTKQVTGR